MELITKYANVIVDLLLSMHNYPEDFELLGQILNIIREILDCDKSMWHSILPSETFSCFFYERKIFSFEKEFLSLSVDKSVIDNIFFLYWRNTSTFGKSFNQKWYMQFSTTQSSCCFGWSWFRSRYFFTNSSNFIHHRSSWFVLHPLIKPISFNLFF